MTHHNHPPFASRPAIFCRPVGQGGGEPLSAFRKFSAARPTQASTVPRSDLTTLFGSSARGEALHFSRHVKHTPSTLPLIFLRAFSWHILSCGMGASMSLPRFRLKMAINLLSERIFASSRW